MSRLAGPLFVITGAAKRVPQRNAVSDWIVRTELRVVVNQIQPNLGSDKSIPPDVKANSSTNIRHEMVAANVIRTVSVVVTVVLTGVEPDAFASDSAQSFSAEALTKTPRINRIKVPKHRTIRDLPSIQRLASSPIHFPLYP